MTRPGLAVLACVFTIAYGVEARAQGGERANDVVMRAMRDELTRSMENLRLDTLQKPYFIAYRVTESHRFSVGARLGSLLGGGDAGPSRFIQIELRVGDYAFDNTNFIGGPMPGMFGGFGQAPMDDDYQEIRRQLWLSTDRTYKAALEAISQKRAAIENRMRADSTADFSRQPATTTSDETPPAPVNRAEAEALVRALSAVFRGMPEIQSSNVSLSAGWSLVRYVNSEGTSYTRATPRATISIGASTQADDGMPMADAYSVSAPSQSQLPGRDSLMSAVRALATGLTSLRRVPLADSYDGPVLFEGDAAAELFGTIIAPKMIGMRRPVGNVQFERALSGMFNDWLEMIGSPVLPRFLSVVDDPTARTLDGVASLEGFRVDDEGVPTRETTVIERGILKTLLTTRVPVAGIPATTGHRRGNGAAPSQVIVTAHVSQPAAELRKKLVELATGQGYEYGIVIKRLANPRAAGIQEPIMLMSMMGPMDGPDGPRMQSLQALKLYPDGREEPIRAAEVTGVNAASFRTILGASQTRAVYSAPFVSRIAFAGAGAGMVTYVVPSLLFANVSLRKPRGGNPKLPVVPPPR